MDKKEFLQYVLDLLHPSKNVTFRAMFGGYGLYKNKVITGLIANNILYFKVGKLNLSDFEKAGSSPFSYLTKDGKKAVMSYWEVPKNILENSQELILWFESAYRASLSTKRK